MMIIIFWEMIIINNCIVVEACLPRRCIATDVVLFFVSRSFPSKGSIRENIFVFTCNNKHNRPLWVPVQGL
jgi:hypothetical protein